MGKITWEHFATKEMSIDGIRMKFEDLCRQLFINEFLSENTMQRTVHCNPNNPGIESDPVIDEKRNRRIGFQVKFFNHDVDYNQIKHSAEKTIEHYAGKIDHVYLFCNKAITVTRQSYIDIVELLSAAGISIEPISDAAVLDLVRKYPNLGLYYFEQHFLTKKWFDDHMQVIRQNLGERYNVAFNVDTRASGQLSLFLHDEKSIVYFNEKKNVIRKKLESFGWRFDKYKTYLNKIEEIVNNIEDVDIDSLGKVFQWDEIFLEGIREELTSITDELEDVKNEVDELFNKVNDKDIVPDEQRAKYKIKLTTQRKHIDDLEELINLSYMLQMSELECQLLTKKILFVEGSAGVGKSHLFASKTDALLDNHRYALLLLGGNYYSDDSIQRQITSNLNIGFSFEELVDILNSWGKDNNRIVPIMIDALNETWRYTLWKNEMPSIMRKIEETEYVRLVVSFRSEYRRALLEDLNLSAVCQIEHQGFNDNSLDAVRAFMNHYGITFTPLHLFNSKITNPLFLTLYCKTYQGDEVDLHTLYERLLQKANDQLFALQASYLEVQGYRIKENLISPIVNAIGEFILSSGKKYFSKEDVIRLPIWDDYRLNPRVITPQLIQENILHSFVYDGEEIIRFSYDQMNDYFTAKAIFSKYTTEKDVREFLINEVLAIKDGEVEKYENVDLFVACCSLYAEKYSKECIDIIEAIQNCYEQNDIFSDYVHSLQWRLSIHLNVEDLIEGCRKYSINPEILWAMFIVNSTKINNPFNANALHDLLFKYTLNQRDHIWTIHINGLENNPGNRMVQLIKMYNAGEKLEFTDKRQIELLLILFSWCLTCSDRWLRDVTSKAMIEILKDEFSLCEYLLRKFQHVNDPYVIQRLYGVVFGAAVKRTSDYKEEYKSLAQYVYDNVFNCGNVYPDILLRDYARLLIERFIFEFPDEKDYFVYDKIVPPYQSEDIPDIDDQGYLTEKFTGGTWRIINSMKFEGMGMYGDFGRYIFQAALTDFEVDKNKIFNYAVYYILNDLGYDEELLGTYDSHVGHYDYNRHNVAKTERIGKKYQWIAMHNILARVSDHYKLIDRFTFKRTEIPFEGAWEPFVRDFDPTLNENNMDCPDVPIFHEVKEHIETARKENAESIPSIQIEEVAWINKETVFFDLQKNDLLLTDNHGTQWVVLSKYADTGRKKLAIDRLMNWNWLYGYLVTEEQKTILRKSVEEKVDILTYDVMWVPETYTVFCREYPWSPGCKSIKENLWVNFEVRTGEKKKIEETIEVFDLEKIGCLWESLTQTSDENCGTDADTDISQNDVLDGKFTLPMKMQTITREEDITVQLGNILHTTVDLMWETGYDASKDETISYGAPCTMIIEEGNLKQLSYDGFYYDADGKLAAFDTRLTEQNTGVVIRKDILDSVLEKKNLSLVWFVNGGKEVHDESTSIVAASDWKGLYIYENQLITGEVFKAKAESYRR